ncbi:hypothetical protein EDD29_7078 [Actinocorallia herbida]|uniref:Uncharacterized protein n=1 Tax=Actinocorallia herbida TaxID=58109 RepID=A0A3N1D8H0_9ACTN|nr:hypothetical protein [Actinocorallia herbida]ROO89388.1 hypothetical protein EDD29_7078 [Actinocorallia herbida]
MLRVLAYLLAGLVFAFLSWLLAEVGGDGLGLVPLVVSAVLWTAIVGAVLELLRRRRS